MGIKGVELKITEGIHGCFYYHYSKNDYLAKALCGATTMRTELPLDSWGYKGHIGERYCQECHDIKLKMESDSDAE